MSKLLVGTFFSVATLWGAAEIAGRAIVYSDEGREKVFEQCYKATGGKIGCVFDSMFSGESDDYSSPGRFASDKKIEAYNVAVAWRNGTLTEKQRSDHSDCIQESVDSALPDRHYLGDTKNESIRTNIKVCISMN